MVLGDDEGEVEAVGGNAAIVEGVESPGDAKLGLDAFEEEGEFAEEDGGVDPSGGLPAEALLHAEAGAPQRLLDAVEDDGQPPDDGLIGLNARLDLGVDEFTDEVVLLHELGGVEDVLDLNHPVGPLVVLEERLEVGEVVVHVDRVGVEVYADQQHLAAVVPHEGNHVVVSAVHVLGSHRQQVPPPQHVVLLPQRAPVQEVLVDLVDVEAELRTHLLPEGLLQVADLAGVLDQLAGADHHVALLVARVLLSLEEVGVGAGEGLLLAYGGGDLDGVLLVGLHDHVVDVDGLGLVGAAHLLEARGHGEPREQEEEVDDGPHGAPEVEGEGGPDGRGGGVDDDGVLGQRLHHLLVPLLEAADVLGRGLRHLAVVVELHAHQLPQRLRHLVHPRHRPRPDDTHQPVIVVLDLQPLGDDQQGGVALPEALAELDEEGVGELDEDAGGPVAGGLVAVHDLPLEDLVVRVGGRVVLGVAPQHLLLVDLEQLGPLEGVVQVEPIDAELLDHGQRLGQQQVPGVLLAVVERSGVLVADGAAVAAVVVDQPALLVHVAQPQLLVLLAHPAGAHPRTAVHDDLHPQLVRALHQLLELVASSEHAAGDGAVREGSGGGVRLAVDLAALVVVALEHAHQVDCVDAQLLALLDLPHGVREGGRLVLPLVGVQTVDEDLVQRQVPDGRRLHDEPPLHGLDGDGRPLPHLVGVRLGLALGPDVEDLVDGLLAVVGQVQQRPVVEPALVELPEAHLDPDVGLAVGVVLDQLRAVPGEDLLGVVGGVAGRLQAEDHALALLDVLDEVVDLEGLAADRDGGVVLRVELPVAVVVEHVQVLHRLLREPAPPLQPDQQPLHPRTVREVQHRPQLLHLEPALHHRPHLRPVPGREVDGLELVRLLGELLEDGGVVVEGSVDVVEVLEPEGGLEVELVEEEGREVDVQVPVRTHRQPQVVQRDLDETVLEQVGVAVLQDPAPQPLLALTHKLLSYQTLSGFFGLGELRGLGLLFFGLELLEQVLRLPVGGVLGGICGVGAVGEQLVVLEGGEDAVGVHDVGVVPLLRVEPGHLPFPVVQLLHLTQVVHLCQDQVHVHHLLVVAPLRVHPAQLTPNLLQVPFLKIVPIRGWIAQQVQQPHRKAELVQDCDVLRAEVFLAAGDGLNLPGLGGLAKSEVHGEEFSLAEGDDLFGGSLLLAALGLREVDARLPLHC